MSEPKPAPSTPAATVVEALAAIMGELGGIEKLTSAERQRRGLGGGEGGISYAYRGVDQIAAAVQPLLAKHGVVVVPFVTASEVKEIQVNNRPWSDTFVTVKWAVYGPNGSMVEACTEGWGRDNSDKGYNKAMTGAFKNLLLRLLCIGDPDDDTDGTTWERDSASDRPRAATSIQDNGPRTAASDRERTRADIEGPREITPAQEVAALFSTLDADTKKIVSTHAKDNLGVGNVMRSGDKAADLLVFIQLTAGTTPEPTADELGLEALQ